MPPTACSGTHGGHVPGLYHYFLFWSAYYACSSAGPLRLRRRRRRGGALRVRLRRRRGARSSAWMDWPVFTLAGGRRQRQGIQQYRELLLSLPPCALPRGDEAGRGVAWGFGRSARRGPAPGPGGASYRRASRVGAAGEMLVSIMAEFPASGANGGAPGAGAGESAGCRRTRRCSRRPIGTGAARHRRLTPPRTRR